MTDLPLGKYRQTLILEREIYVSTIVRESSAREHMSNYFETMAFPYVNDPGRGILWHSAAQYERAADRQHDLAVRWFSR